MPSDANRFEGRTIEVRCPCGRGWSAPASLAGLGVECPACRAVTRVPTFSDASGFAERDTIERLSGRRFGVRRRSRTLIAAGTLLLVAATSCIALLTWQELRFGAAIILALGGLALIIRGVRRAR